MPANLDRASVAKMIDHTLLRPEATRGEVEALCAEARELGVGAVCVSPSFLPLDPAWLPREVALAVVAGFPSGAHRSDVKAFEAASAVGHGADEVDVVANLGWLREGRWAWVGTELEAVRKACGDAVLKVILESALLDDEPLATACRVAVEAGADYVKTSTGFHPAGGATVGAVATMRAAVGAGAGVKASGGIRTADDARAMVAAGASRLGCSASRAILAGFER